MKNLELARRRALEHVEDVPRREAVAAAPEPQLRGDLGGLKSVTSSLSRAKSVTDVAVAGAEQIDDLVNQMSAKAYQAADAGIDASSLAGINKDFTAAENVDYMLSEWAQRAPVFKQWVGAGVLHSERKDSDALTPTRQKTGCYPVEVRCIGFKMNNYKGTGEAKQWTFELRGDGASAEAEPGRRRRIPWGPAAGVGAALCLGALVVLRSRR